MIVSINKNYAIAFKTSFFVLLVWTLMCAVGFAETDELEQHNRILLEQGCFEMGSEESVSEEPVHKVCVSSFYLDKFEITQGNFEAIMGFNPSTSKGKDFPVVNVSWIEAEQFCRKKGGRLPSEAEWEYANRAGTKTPYFWGSEMDGEFAWFKENSREAMHSIGMKKPNSWGLHDMNGNVWEWVSDWYREDYYEMSAKTIPNENPQGPPTGQFLLIRGGSYKDDSFFLRSAARFWYEPIVRAGDLGFRCASNPVRKAN